MDNYDDVFASSQNRSTSFTPASEFNKEAWAAGKQTERNEVYEMMDSATESVLASGSNFQSYLDTLARFDRYSSGNILLILAQMPEATQLRDFDGWKENGASIKKNVKGIRILEPGDEYTREDGTIGVSYNVKKVFDISQTTARIQQQEQPDMRQYIKALTQTSPVSISVSEHLSENVAARYDPKDRAISIRKGMSAPNIICALSQEIAHAHMAEDSERYDRAEGAFVAYCTAYVVGKCIGLDTSRFSFEELPKHFAELEPQAGRAELGRIREAASFVIEGMSRHLNDIKKEPQKNQAER